MADPTAIVDDIAAGVYDDDLGRMFDALFARASETETAFGWKLKLGDDVWTVETVTLQELAFAERAVSTASNKVSYIELDPLRSMDHLVALIVGHLHHVNSVPMAKAVERAQQLTVTDLKDIVSAYEVRKAPKADAGETSTNS